MIRIPRSLSNPYLLLVLTTLFWSGNMVLARGIRHDIPPVTLAFWRWVIAFCLVLPFAYPHWKTQGHLLKQKKWVVLTLGILGIAGYNTLAYIGLHHTTATNTVLLNSFAPIATMLLAWLFLGKKLHWMQSVGALISLLGVFAIISQGNLATLTEITLNRGDLWIICAVLIWALYTLGLQFRPAGVAPMLLMAALTGTGLMTLFPFYLWELWQSTPMTINLHSLLGLAYVGIFPSFIGYVFYNRGVAEIGASQASLFIHLMPVFGSLLAAIFLQERPTPAHFIGISLIFLGIALVTRYPAETPEPAQARLAKRDSSNP